MGTCQGLSINFVFFKEMQHENDGQLCEILLGKNADYCCTKILKETTATASPEQSANAHSCNAFSLFCGSFFSSTFPL